MLLGRSIYDAAVHVLDGYKGGVVDNMETHVANNLLNDDVRKGGIEVKEIFSDGNS